MSLVKRQKRVSVPSRILSNPEAEEVTVTETQGNITIDLSQGRVFLMTIDGAATFTFQNPVKYRQYIISIVNGGLGEHEITLPNDLKFDGSSIPSSNVPSKFVSMFELRMMWVRGYYSGEWRQVV